MLTGEASSQANCACIYVYIHRRYYVLRACDDALYESGCVYSEVTNDSKTICSCFYVMFFIIFYL